MSKMVSNGKFNFKVLEKINFNLMKVSVLTDILLIYVLKRFKAKLN